MVFTNLAAQAMSDPPYAIDKVAIQADRRRNCGRHIFVPVFVGAIGGQVYRSMDAPFAGFNTHQYGHCPYIQVFAQP
ncbi:unnamed protein product [Umbelopsis ramanniana]